MPDSVGLSLENSVKLKPEQEQEIIILFASGQSQFRISEITGYDSSAVRRVLRDYRRATALWPKLKAKPSTLARVFRLLAQLNNDREVEICWPVPRVSKGIWERLSPLMERVHQGPQLAGFIDLSNEVEDLQALDEMLDECSGTLLRHAASVGIEVPAEAQQTLAEAQEAVKAGAWGGTIARFQVNSIRAIADKD